MKDNVFYVDNSVVDVHHLVVYPVTQTMLFRMVEIIVWSVRMVVLYVLLLVYRYALNVVEDTIKMQVIVNYVLQLVQDVKILLYVLHVLRVMFLEIHNVWKLVNFHV